eukprot:TRINITY_DN4957_c0_g1_i1.p2 TRINITY_DN4957_c0_g1~~TRINITY_DN4957_c0_g1_i1.p2  ORF type:complete len:486 (+),score=64.11 TRINITY_DN4957_c0_g1_i1:1747-3204(+)
MKKVLTAVGWFIVGTSLVVIAISAVLLRRDDFLSDNEVLTLAHDFSDLTHPHSIQPHVIQEPRWEQPVAVLPDCGSPLSRHFPHTTASQCVARIRPLPLELENVFQIPEHNPDYNPEVEKLAGPYVYKESNVLLQARKVPVLQGWFHLDPLNDSITRAAACSESSTLCEAFTLLEQWRSGSVRLISGTRIPAIIHQSAHKSPFKNSDFHDHFQPVLHDSVSSYSQKNQGYTHLFWDDDDVVALVKYCYPHLIGLFRALPMVVLQADLFRYLLILRFGGFYGDVDTMCLKPIDSWLDYNSLTSVNGKNVTSSPGKVQGIFGIESDLLFLHRAEPGRILENTFFPHPSGFGQFAFASAPDTDVMQDIVGNTTRNLMYLMSLADQDLVKLKNLLRCEFVLKLTGPAVTSQVVNDHLTAKVGIIWSDLTELREPFTAGDVLRILPITAFNNGNHHFMGQGYVHEHQALINHQFAGSWKKNPEAPKMAER